MKEITRFEEIIHCCPFIIRERRRKMGQIIPKMDKRIEFK